MAACLVWLAGCETSSKLGDLFRAGEPEAQAVAPPADPKTTGTVPQPVPGPPGAPAMLAAPSLLGSDPHDDLNLGKKQFRAQNYGLAEQHFRRAVEQHPRDGEAWAGLAASYDRLRRFELADRAYEQAVRIMGPTVELLNNQGFSYMLRGDYRRARLKFDEALARDPANPHAQANLKLLEDSFRKRKSIE
jgi:Flp pilus assembly protein TadD